MSYVDFCQAIESVASAQRRVHSYRPLLRSVRDLTVYSTLENCHRMVNVKFKKGDGANFAPYPSEEWYNMNWTDFGSARAIVQAWIDKNLKGSLQVPPKQQERLINVLWLLGTHIRLD